MRNFTVVDAEQRSPAWFAARLGRLTGSKAKDILAKVAKGEAAARRDYRMQLALERLTGELEEESYVNADMQRGIDLEPQAFVAYEAATGHVAQRSGFVSHDVHMAGCSLDGHIGDFEGLLEVKCPRPANHFRYLRGGVLPDEHRAQVFHNLWVTGAAWADFVSFCPKFPRPLFVFRVERDETAIQVYEQAALAFLKEVDQEVQAVRTMSDVGAVLREVTNAI